MAEGDETIVLSNNIHSIPNHINKDGDVKDGVLYDKLEPPPKEVLQSLRHSPAKENHTNHEDISHLHSNAKLSPIKETDADTLKTVPKDINDEVDDAKLQKKDLVTPSTENEEVANNVTHLEKENSITALQTPQKIKKTKNHPPSESKALLDQPLELTGKRERRTIERLVMPVTSSQKKQPISLSKGLGTELGQCGEVEKRIAKAKPEELKILHKILFGTLGQVTLLRKHIRKFNGFEFSDDSEEYKKKLEVLNKLTVANLKDICNLLVISKGSGKEDIIPRLMEYLMKPEPSEKMDKKKKTSLGSSSPKKGGSKSTGGGKESSAKKRKKTAAAHDTIALRSDQDDSTSEEEEETPSEPEAGGGKEGAKKKGRPKGSSKKEKNIESEEDKEDQESEEEEPSEPDDDQDDDFSEPTVSKKRKKATPKKKDFKVAKIPASGKKRGKTPKATPKKGNKADDDSTNAKARGVGATSAKVIYTDTEDEEGNEEQPLSEPENKMPEKRSKKKKANKDEIKHDEKDAAGETTDQTNGKEAPNLDNNSYPTEEEIKGAVQDILEGADLMEITMKTVCKKVYDKYSSHDLTPKKDFIKQTVKSLIS